MSAPSPLKGHARPLYRDPIERLADESLHDFLLRRHDEMVSELDALEVEVVWKEVHLRYERLAADRRHVWLIAGLALDATLAMLLVLAGIFDAVPVSMAAITLTVLLAGNLFALAMPRFDPLLAKLQAWSW
ncbi:MAG: hypothetical protein ACRCVA_24570 [Phreatobacter sp.]